MDAIVNDMEMESIIQENNSRSDRARGLIDCVRRKGDRASRKLIAHIQSRDPELFAELGLSCGQPAPPGELRVESGSSVHSNRIQHFVFFKLQSPRWTSTHQWMPSGLRNRTTETLMSSKKQILSPLNNNTFYFNQLSSSVILSGVPCNQKCHLQSCGSGDY